MRCFVGFVVWSGVVGIEGFGVVINLSGGCTVIDGRGERWGGSGGSVSNWR